MSVTGSFDEDRPSAGYAVGRFSAEAGDGRRQNVVSPGGLAVLPGSGIAVTRRTNDRWNLTLVWHADALLLFSISTVGESEPTARVEQIDPTTLEAIGSSENLAMGEHLWPGCILVHRNGDIYVVAGYYLHRLNSALGVVGSLQLPTDRPYDSLLAMDDGRLITKDLQPSGTNSRFTVVDAETLSVVMEAPIPEATLGRCCAKGDDIYVPGDLSIFRFKYRRGAISRDVDWTGRYRSGTDGHGWASDLVVGGGHVWLHDNSDTQEIRGLLQTSPIGSRRPDASFHQSFDTPYRLHAISTADSTRHMMVEPFELMPGWSSSAPTFVPSHDLVITFDSVNGGLAAFALTTDGELEPRWQVPIRNHWQPLAFPDTGEVVVNDAHLFEDDNIVVLDLVTGHTKALVRSGSSLPSSRSATPGADRDIFYVSSDSVFRVSFTDPAQWAPPDPATRAG